MKDFFTLFLSIIALLPLSAQQFPTCSDMEVQRIKLNNSNDTLIIDVYNDCADCDQHVYTGLLVFNSAGDTLGVNVNLDAQSNPLNKNAQTYYLVGLNLTDIQDIARVKMNHLCDSLPLANTALGIDPGFDLQVEIFPNPATTFIRIAFNEELRFSDASLLSLSGKLVRDLNIDSENPIAVHDLAPGMYLLTINTNKGLVTRKLVIE